MSSTERRKEVIETFLVGEIDDGEAKAHFIAVSFEEVVMSNGGVKETSWSDARRVMVVILRSWTGDADSGGTIL